MSSSKDEAIRTRAYQIWEEQGRPEGQHHEHWHRAATEHEGMAGGQGNSHPGMMGDGTEEQNLGQPGDPKARITEAEVKAAFGDKAGPAPGGGTAQPQTGQSGAKR